ncbi:hypothetical protein HK405_002238, partial [Cladochytrium tenue]
TERGVSAETLAKAYKEARMLLAGYVIHIQPQLGQIPSCILVKAALQGVCRIFKLDIGTLPPCPYFAKQLEESGATEDVVVAEAAVVDATVKSLFEMLVSRRSKAMRFMKGLVQDFVEDDSDL